MPLRPIADVLAAAQALRKERGIGIGEAVNELARAGLARKQKPRDFNQRTADVGISSDVSNIAETLELLDSLKSTFP